MSTVTMLRSQIDSENMDGVDFRLPSGARTAIRAFPCGGRSVRGWPISTLLVSSVDTALCASVKVRGSTCFHSTSTRPFLMM